jgi:YD repeat-containing protein
MQSQESIKFMKIFTNEKLYASDLNNALYELGNNVSITYNDDQTIKTITDNNTSTTYTLSWSMGKLVGYTDGTHTWTLTYSSDGSLVTGITMA